MLKVMPLSKRKVFGIAVILLLLVSLGVGIYLAQQTQIFKPKAATSDCAPGSLQQMVDAASPGSTIYAPGCINREAVYINKPLTLVGTNGTEIRGSDVWTNFKKEGDYWVSEQTLPGPEMHDNFPWCQSSRYSYDRNDPGYNYFYNQCSKAEQVFINGKPVDQVGDFIRKDNNGNEIDRKVITPKSGQFKVTDNRKLLLGDDPAGKTVEVSVRSRWINADSENVTIKDFIMKHATNRAQDGALRVRSNSTVEGNNLSYAHGPNLSANGENINVLNNEISYSGQLGIGGGRYVSSVNGVDVSVYGKNITLKGNKIHHNNIENFEPGWEAGSVKFANTGESIWENNEISFNNGFGIWCDIGCDGITIRNNRVNNNSWAGIDYEISRKGEIHNNIVYENGYAAQKYFESDALGAGIIIFNSQDSRVYDNVLVNNDDGIIVEANERVCGEDDVFADYMFGSDRRGSTGYNNWLNASNVNLITKVKVFRNTVIMTPRRNDPNSFAIGWFQQKDAKKLPGCNAPEPTVLFTDGSDNAGFENKIFIENNSAQLTWDGSRYSDVASFANTRGGERNIALSAIDRDFIAVANGTSASRVILPAPSNLRAVCSADNKRVFLGWDRLVEAGAYHLRLDNKTDSWEGKTKGGAGGDVFLQLRENYIVQNVIPGVNYNFNIQALPFGVDTHTYGGTNSTAAIDFKCGEFPKDEIGPTTTITPSKRSDFRAGEEVSITFNAKDNEGGSGVNTIFVSVWPGVSSKSQIGGVQHIPYYDPGASKTITATAPFYLEAQAVDNDGAKEEPPKAFAAAATTPQPVSAAPNCLSLSGPTTAVVGQNLTYSATFTSPGDLWGSIYAGQNGQLLGGLRNSVGNETQPIDLPGSSTTHNFIWTPSMPGVYDIYCNSITINQSRECRGNANYKDQHEVCAGPTSSIQVTVNTPTAPPTTPPTAVPTPQKAVERIVFAGETINSGGTLNLRLPGDSSRSNTIPVQVEIFYNDGTVDSRVIRFEYFAPAAVPATDLPQTPLPTPTEVPTQPPAPPTPPPTTTPAGDNIAPTTTLTTSREGNSVTVNCSATDNAGGTGVKIIHMGYWPGITQKDGRDPQYFGTPGDFVTKTFPAPFYVECRAEDRAQLGGANGNVEDPPKSFSAVPTAKVIKSVTVNEQAVAIDGSGALNLRLAGSPETSATIPVRVYVEYTDGTSKQQVINFAYQAPARTELPAPTNFSVKCEDQGKAALLRWDNVAGAGSYQVRLDKNKGTWRSPEDGFLQITHNSVYMSVIPGQTNSLDVQAIPPGLDTNSYGVHNSRNNIDFSCSGSLPENPKGENIPPTPLITPSKLQGFSNGEQVTVDFIGLDNPGGSGVHTLHIAVWPGKTDASQKDGNYDYSPANGASASRTYTVPFYVEVVAEDNNGNVQGKNSFSAEAR